MGLLIAIVGWFFDNLSRYPWLLEKISPHYYYGTDALNILKVDQKRVIIKEHNGFNVLLNRWPKLDDKSGVEYVARTAAYIEFGSVTKNEIQIMVLDDKGKEKGPRWTISSAENILLEEHRAKTFCFSGIIFFGGILLTFVSGLVEFLRNK